MTLPAGDHPRQQQVPDSGRLVIRAAARAVNTAAFADRIPPDTRSVSLFLVNERNPTAERARDEVFAFQTELEVRSAVPFVPRPDPRGVPGGDADERVADLHYAGTPEYATGHGVAADWVLSEGASRLLRTTWIPSAEVETTVTVDVPGVELDMTAFGDLSGGGDAERALTPLVTGYRAWIDQQEEALADFAGERREPTELSRASTCSCGIRMRSTRSALRTGPWP